MNYQQYRNLILHVAIAMHLLFFEDKYFYNSMLSVEVDRFLWRQRIHP